MRLCALLAAILITVNLAAQNALPEDLELARNYYSKQEYEQARILFESTEEVAPLSVEDERLLIRTYEALGHRSDAIERLESVIKRSEMQNEDLLSLVDLYRKEAMYSEALFALDVYEQKGGRKARKLRTDIEFAQYVLASEKNCDLENLVYNTSSSESGVTFLGDEMVYSAQRIDLDRRFAIKGVKDARPESALIKVEETSTNIMRSSRSGGDRFGFASYSENGRMMVYVRSHYRANAQGMSRTEENTALYYSKMGDDGEWEDDMAFPYNSDAYANGFPYLSEDGQTLFYASTMDNGFGGFDLYSSQFENGSWSAPVNLGEDVNTPGNEITPFLNENKLYFASDYLPGLGGYDVFSIKKVENTWSGLSHMGACVNSPEDDFGFIVDPKAQSGYFSSTRKGGRGNDDIYKIANINNVTEIDVVQPTMSALPQVTQQQDKNWTAKSAITADEIAIPALNLEVETQQFSSHLLMLSDNEMIESEVLAPSEGIDLNTTTREGLFNQLNYIQHEAIGMDIEDDYPEQEVLDAEDIEGILIMEDASIFNLDLMPYEKVYFIQIASLAKYTSNLGRFNHFKRFGNVYAMRAGGMVKIRLGYYQSKAEAIKVLKVLKEKGIKEAFIVGDILDANRLELLTARTESVQDTRDEELVPSYRSKYKVRVASYHSPNRFQTKKISDLGNIEHWTKGEWKIIVLSGFATKGRAESVLRQCKKRGFKDAFLVQEQDGELLRVR